MAQVDLFADLAPLPTVIAGVDEAGRGPLAGAVYAAAVILNPARLIDGLADSKVLAAERRETLAEEIKAGSLAWCVAFATVQEIDTMNILRATLLAMQRAVQGLATAPQLALIDGNQAPRLSCAVQTVIKGDASSRCGVSMKGINIVVHGNIGHMSAFMGQSGHLVVLGNAGVANPSRQISTAKRVQVDRVHTFIKV